MATPTRAYESTVACVLDGETIASAPGTSLEVDVAV